MSRRRLLLSAGAAALALSACGSTSDDAATEATSDAPAATGQATDGTDPSEAAETATTAPAATDVAPSGSPAPERESTEAVPADTSPAETAADTTAAPVAVPEALQFSAPLVGGGEIDAASLAGTPTVFWFWAPT